MIYFYSVLVLGTGVTVLSAIQTVRFVDYQWLFLACMTLLTGAFPVKIPGMKSRISIADTFTFTNLMLFGPAAGTLTASIDALMGSVRSKTRKWEQAAFNVAATALSVFIASHLFFGMLGRGPLFGGEGITLREIIAPAAVLATVHYLINSGSVATIIALERRENIYLIWKENFLWTSLTYLAGASVAALVAVNVSAITPAVVVIVVPMLLVTYFIYHNYLQKVREHARRLEDMNRLYFRTVESLALAVDAKDQTTYGHIRRVKAYAMGLARAAGITDRETILAIETGSLLHDIGKLAVDDYILNKPGKLTPGEFDWMKMHTTAGDEILQQIQFPFPVAECVRSHHERWDGTGYPAGLEGEAIPVSARLLTIADTFDAIRSSRPYKSSCSLSSTLEVMRQDAGTVYDPRLLQIFIANIDQLEAEAEEACQTIPQLSFRQYARIPGESQVSAPRDLDGLSKPTDTSAELISLYEFFSSFARSLNIEDLLANLDLRIRRIFPCTTCILYLNNGNQTLTAAHVGGKHRDMLRGSVVEFGRGISGWAAAYRLPMSNAHPKQELHSDDGTLDSLTDSLVVPMVHEEECVGTISLFSDGTSHYTETDLHLLYAIADQAGHIIVKARNEIHAGTDEALVDPATGVKKASSLCLVIPRLISEAKENDSVFVLIHVEATNLSELADMYGLQIRTEILSQIAQHLRPAFRSKDLLVRYGEDAFIALIEGMGEDQAHHRAGILLRQIEDKPIVNPSGRRLKIDYEVRFATYPQDATSLWTLLEAVQKRVVTPPQSSLTDSESKVVIFSSRS